ncbi:MAG: nitroreductase family protein [Firmicutes bacterium]|nr:nitroreductase family protein [Bacillota bacterium]
MDALQAILTRASVRDFTDQPISDGDLHTILEAGMSGPSCVNARDWSFLVTRDPEILTKMAEANGRPAEPLKKATLGILVLGDLERAFPRAPEYWVVDGSIACQNMILAAKALGIGSVWLGTWPQMDRVERQQALFDLPETVVPHSLIAFGYPADPELKGRGFYEEDRVHMDKW